MKALSVIITLSLVAPLMLVNSCKTGEKKTVKEKDTLAGPIHLITDLYSADPSAHVFDGKIYIYPSHDIESGIPENDLGDQYDMKDYRVYSMEQIPGEVTDHGEVLNIKDVPWAGRQMWAPDAAMKDDKYYLYFPAKDKEGIFHIGVAVSDSPAGPFKAEENYIEGSYSMDPAVFMDDDGIYYMYFGGIWGGQLQMYRDNIFDPENTEPAPGEPALGPRIAKMSDDMLGFAEESKEVSILDEEGNPILAGDNSRRFFEASWVHKYDGKYYLSWSTGDTHFICYGIGENPYGPFTYKGVILTPVIGWTSHHSILEFDGSWYLFHHDSELSGGKSHLRNVKVAPLKYNADGTIQTIEGTKK